MKVFNWSEILFKDKFWEKFPRLWHFSRKVYRLQVPVQAAKQKSLPLIFPNPACEWWKSSPIAPLLKLSISFIAMKVSLLHFLFSILHFHFVLENFMWINQIFRRNGSDSKIKIANWVAPELAFTINVFAGNIFLTFSSNGLWWYL